MARKQSLSAFARKLQNLGIPVEFDEEAAPAILIRQSGSMPENSAFSIGRGTGVIISICITSDLPSLAISRIELGLPWFDKTFQWLDAPTDSNRASGLQYCFPGEQYGFDRDSVLNHRIDILTILRRGSSIEGLLLGFRYGPIPPELFGKKVPAFLTVSDQFDEQYSADIDFWVQRPDPQSAACKPKSKRKPLFESPDPVPERVMTGKTRPIRQ